MNFVLFQENKENIFRNTDLNLFIFVGFNKFPSI
jgi:hypothetical protein